MTTLELIEFVMVAAMFGAFGQETRMDIAQPIWINTIVLVVIVMLVLVFLFGVSRELRKTAEAVGRVEDTARDIARFLAEKLA